MTTLRQRVAAKRREQTLALKKAAICFAIAAAGFTMLGACASDTSHQRLVEETYTVQQGDTLRTIAEAYLPKNTGGRRYILEFEEGIEELNPWIVENHYTIHPGDKIKITYWVKDGKEDDE